MSRFSSHINWKLFHQFIFLGDTNSTNSFSASPIFGQVQKFFFRKCIASSVFMLEKYIETFFFFFFFSEGFEVFFFFFFQINMKTNEKSSQK